MNIKDVRKKVGRGIGYYNGIDFNFLNDGKYLYINIIKAKTTIEDLNYILSICDNKSWVKKQIEERKIEEDDEYDEYYDELYVQEKLTKLKSMGYTVGQQLGKGSFAEVYLIEKDDKKYACKIYIDESQFNTDINNIKSIGEHPNIVKFIESPLQDVALFEYYEKDLTVFYTYKGYDINIIKSLMYQLLKGLEHIHSKGYVHQDIKPGNILIKLVNNKLHLAIADFGNSEPISKLTVDSKTTPFYKSPEALTCKPVTELIDMWSVGCVLSFILNKDDMFKGKNSINQIYIIYTKLKLTETLHFSDQSIKELHPNLDDEGVKLLSGLYNMYPKQRLTASNALKSKWFDKM